jgi:hypothetical protein
MSIRHVAFAGQYGYTFHGDAQAELMGLFEATYTTALNSLPTPAVIPIASVPQKATRRAPLATDAPPA